MKMKQLAVLSVALVATSAMAQIHQKVEGLVGKPLPAFTMKDISGKTYTQRSLRGKVVILDFWANWCAPCKAASPTMDGLQKKYGAKGFVVIGANTTDPVTTVTRYKTQHGYTYPFTHTNQAICDKFGIVGLPVFMFVDRKGVVRRVETGFYPGKSPASFEATVKKLL
jgi:thiol-disulfide isomerase/thioredoxin